MILKIQFTQCRNKIAAIKFLRTVGKIGLKEAKELVETCQVPDGFNQPVGTSMLSGYTLTGSIRVKVNPEHALSGVLASLNGAANSNYVPVPVGMFVYTELIDPVVDIS